MEEKKESDDRGGERRHVLVVDDEEAARYGIRRALSNLLHNALQATPDGGRILVSGQRQGATLLLEVRDTGPGVPPEQRDKIWEPFYTTKQRGTGLGLAIVRKRVEEVGGTARLAAAGNGNGNGARFELVVPLREQTTHDAA